MRSRQGKKDDIITFKVDSALAGIIKSLPNRSEFIRSAVLAALDNVCPLCLGTGILSPEQRKHWNDFTHDHEIQECERCQAVYLVCSNKSESPDDPH